MLISVLGNCGPSVQEALVELVVVQAFETAAVFYSPHLSGLPRHGTQAVYLQFSVCNEWSILN